MPIVTDRLTGGIAESVRRQQAAMQQQAQQGRLSAREQAVMQQRLAAQQQAAMQQQAQLNAASSAAQSAACEAEAQRARIACSRRMQMQSAQRAALQRRAQNRVVPGQMQRARTGGTTGAVARQIATAMSTTAARPRVAPDQMQRARTGGTTGAVARQIATARSTTAARPRFAPRGSMMKKPATPVAQYQAIRRFLLGGGCRIPVSHINFEENVAKGFECYIGKRGAVGANDLIRNFGHWHNDIKEMATVLALRMVPGFSTLDGFGAEPAPPTTNVQGDRMDIFHQMKDQMEQRRAERGFFSAGLQLLILGALGVWVYSWGKKKVA